MESKNTFILHETEAFMRGELDNVTVAHGRIVLDLVSGGHVPYGCYTSPAVPLPTFDALRVSWNAGTPPGTAVEAQARVMVDGNWTSWSSFGRWSPYLEREGAVPVTKGAVNLLPDSLVLDSKTATQAQLRIYLYTKDEHTTPSVSLVGVSVRAVDVIPAGGRPINARLHLMPYAVARRAPALQPVMDLAICLASLTNRWGADILPEEFALAMRDCRSTDAERNLSFAAAAAGCWGFPCWACWGNLALLRSEVRAGYGVIVGLESTPAQQAAGMPPLRYAALRGFRQGAQPKILPPKPSFCWMTFWLPGTTPPCACASVTRTVPCPAAQPAPPPGCAGCPRLHRICLPCTSAAPSTFCRMISALHCLPQLHPPRRKKLRQKMPPPPMHRILQIPRPKSPFRRRLPPRQHRYMAAFWRGPHWMSTPMPPLRTASSTMSPRNRAASGWPFPLHRVPAQNRASTPFTPSNLPALCWWAM